MASGEVGSGLVFTALGVAAGSLAGLAIGKISRPDVVAMHWVSPSNVSWYALGIPSQKKFYLISGNYIFAFLKEALPDTIKVFASQGKEATPLVPEDYVFGGILTDSGALSLPR